MNKKLILLVVALCGFRCAFSQNITKANDTHIRYAGRIIFKGDSAALSWTGSSIKVNFSGTGIKALLKDEHGENYFKIIVDGKIMPDLDLDSTKHLYSIVSKLNAGKHTLELFKRTEWQFGKTWFYGLHVENGILTAAPKPNKRKIEFYGNSITCGYAVLDTAGKDRGTNDFEDGYLSYAAITARHFDAEYSCIAKSGIGVLVSWFSLIMPEMYDRADATDANSKWKFKNYTPDVVVVNVFQNDAWIVKMPDNPQFKSRFGTTPPNRAKIIAAYQKLISNIRSKYPHAQIICALGSMDAVQAGAPWPGYITEAVKNLHDDNIKAHFFAYKNTPGHPSKAEQQVMADDLIGYIEKNIKW